MHLTFSPALGQETVLKVAPKASGSERPAAESVLFKATFDNRESLLEARADGIKVELWSDVPVGGRSYGEWGASRFGPLETESTPPQEVPTFSLGDASEDDDLSSENSLYVRLRVPLHDHVGARFSFTYRLVYPSGEVRWLGEFGRNGELLVEQGLPGVDLREGWNISDDGTYRTHAFPGERVLGQLADPETWACWSWNPSSLPTYTGAREAREGLAMILSPQTYTRTVNVPRPLVFAASHSTKLKITAEGKIVLHSSSPFARVSFSVLEHSRELLDGVAALCHGEVLVFDDTSAVLSCRPADAEFPIHLVVLPMADQLGELALVPLTYRALPKEASGWDAGFVLSSPDMRVVKSVPASALQADPFALVGTSGYQLLLAPVHELSVDAGVMGAALLTPHKNLTLKIDRSVAQTLPTPPPSPPRSSAPMPASAAGEPRPSSSPSPKSSAPPWVSKGRRTEVSQGRRRPASLALIPYQSPHLLRRYLHIILNIVFWFWSTFVRALAVRLVGESATRRISGLLGLALVKTAPPAPPRPTAGNRVKAHGERRTEIGEPVAEDTASASDLLVAVPEEESRPDIVAPSPQNAQDAPRETQDSQASQPSPRIVLSAVVPSQCSEGPVVLLKGRNAIKDLRATVDGKPIPSQDAKTVTDETRLLMFDALEAGGELEISFGL
ncbi:hypothetical protein BV20DRAFT_1011471 [Pilatotrama ljubarskyi]|nr:hypothetical protein BV20DRAFT_1011471 [Pilatotrama ljubarskyi]